MVSRRPRGDSSPTTEPVVPGPRSDDATPPALAPTEAVAEQEPVAVPAPREGQPADPAWDEVWLPQWTAAVPTPDEPGTAEPDAADGGSPPEDTTAREALVRAALELDVELQALRREEAERTDLRAEEERAALRLAAEVLAAESARGTEPAVEPDEPPAEVPDEPPAEEPVPAEEPEPAEEPVPADEPVAVRTPPVAPRRRARILLPLAVLLVAAGVGLASTGGSSDPEQPTVAAAGQDAGGAASTTPSAGRARPPR